MKIERTDLRPLRCKYEQVCPVCKQKVPVGVSCYYHIKIKKVVHTGCISGEIDAPVVAKRPKIFGLYTQSEIIAYAFKLNVPVQECVKLLGKLHVEITPSTEATVTTTYNDCNNPKYAEKFKNIETTIRDIHKKAIQALLEGSDLTPAEQNAVVQVMNETPTQNVDLTNYVTKDECSQKIADAVREVKELYQPVEVIIKKLDHKPINTGKQHFMFPELLSWISVGANVWLTGPAGSGKSRGAKEVAKHLDLKFYSVSFDKMMPTSKLTGYMDANGKYVRTSFRDWAEHGGLMLFDEIDAGNANTITAMNDVLAAEAGDWISFPDKMIKKHKDAIGIATANTYGQGANRVYVGRCEQDGASLDRFIFLDWSYDEALELHISGNEDWVKTVQRYRRAADTLGIRHIISPRASIKGAIALKAGMDQEKVEQAVIWKGLADDQVEKIKKAAAQEN